MRGLGVDAVDIARFAAVLERRPRLRERLFTAEELVDAGERRGTAASLAARFAAREATMKALGVGLGAFDFRDVSVARTGSGAPRLVVTGRARARAAPAAAPGWPAPLSHTAAGPVAVAAAR